MLNICNESKEILYLSNAYEGIAQDYGLCKTLFPPSQKWFAGKTVRVDLGFLGFDKDYPATQIALPHKRSKHKELTETQKIENKQLASERIVVEHTFGGLKRYRLLAERARFRNWTLYNTIVGVCAGLWNFYLKN